MINKEGKIIYDINNYIIAEFDIKKDNQNVRIINSYEQCNREDPFRKYYKKEYENEKEIKENCEIRIEDKIIPFSYFYKFNKKGKYNIKYIFKKKLTKLDYMFRDCSFLTNINLSYFNTNNVTNMRWIFCGCSSLININLSYICTNNVTNMSGIFYDCSSLTNINLSNFKTNNVTDMSSMFDGCSSLSHLNLSNFNTNNVTNMFWMFKGCNKLIKDNIIVKDKKILEEFKYQ